MRFPINTSRLEKDILYCYQLLEQQESLPRRVNSAAWGRDVDNFFHSHFTFLMDINK